LRLLSAAKHGGVYFYAFYASTRHILTEKEASCKMAVLKIGQLLDKNCKKEEN
jgi:hypothetical protein